MKDVWKSGSDDVVIIDTPAKCREFIKSIRIGPKNEKARKIEFLEQADGKRVSIDEASDAQVEQVAMELADALNKASAH